MEKYLIHEQKSDSIKIKKAPRKIKCPYCIIKDTRENLVFHIDEIHHDMIPENYTAARILFNHINKKEHGSCIICRRETDWNEDTYRYNRLCNMPACEKKYVATMKSRMVNKYGKEHLLDDIEYQQATMLSNRKISGTYTFRDGKEKSYCGTYERKALEFYDKVLKADSKDVLTPGPVIEYEYKGKTLKWITDLYYVPANLAHDVKDGGDNPNNREMEEYRAKQDAKEAAISKLGTYNYIRLTNNSFDQLILILAEIKQQMIGDDSKHETIIRINEEVAMGAIVPANPKTTAVYIVPYQMTNTFGGSGIAFTNNPCMDNLLVVDEDGKIKKKDKKFLENCNYDIYKYIGENFEEKYLSILKALKEGKEVYDKYYFYKALTGKEVLSENQYSYDENFSSVLDAYVRSEEYISCLESTIDFQYLDILKRNSNIMLLNKNDIREANHIMKGYSNINILQEMTGNYFVINLEQSFRSKSYNNILDIPAVVLDIVDKWRCTD